MENVIEKYTDKDQNRRKKLLFIYNPNAGTGVLKPNLSDILVIFVNGGCERSAVFV